MKKALFVTYHFPPEGGGSGVLRSLKFSKYLPQHGWRPHILTLNESFYPVKDLRLLNEIVPAVTVHRTFALDSSRHLAIKGRYVSLFAIPDRFISWLPFGILRGLRIIRKEGIRILLSTSPPPTTHLIAAALKAITGLPWVADFRDPWIEEGLFPQPGTLRYFVEKSLEKTVITRADRLVVTTPHLKRELLCRYPELSWDRVSTIYNGYDEDDFQFLGNPPRGKKFEIIHTGLVTPEYRDPLPLLKAIAYLIKNGDLPRALTQITFLGCGSYVDSEEFLVNIEKLDLKDIVEIRPRVPHQQALESLESAALLLVLQASDDTRTLIPAKTFEYLRVGRPILALTFEGATAELLEGHEHCYIVNPFDQESLIKAVLSAYLLWRRSPDWNETSRPIQQYERSTLTGKLSSLMDMLVQQRHDKGMTN